MDKAIRHRNRFAAKQEIGIPFMVRDALMEDGWLCRQTIIWHKPNAMPESVRDRCTKAHEYLFLLSKSPRYFFDADAIAERADTAGSQKRFSAARCKASGRTATGLEATGEAMTVPDCRNKRSVWTVTPKPFKGAHFAVMPPDLVAPCVLAGTSSRGVCPHCGAPWVRKVERLRVATRPGKDTKVTGDTLTDGNRDPERHVTTSRTVGWEQGCECPAAEPVGAVVLEPFVGSGTTLAVAVENRRRAVGSELNPEYLPLVRERLATVTPSLFDAA